MSSSRLNQFWIISVWKIISIFAVGLTCDPVSPCQNGGKCTSENNLFKSCACLSGYTGILCQERGTMLLLYVKKCSLIKLSKNTHIANVFRICFS